MIFNLTTTRDSNVFGCGQLVETRHTKKYYSEFLISVLEFDLYLANFGMFNITTWNDIDMNALNLIVSGQ